MKNQAKLYDKIKLSHYITANEGGGEGDCPLLDPCLLKSHIYFISNKQCILLWVGILILKYFVFR